MRSQVTFLPGSCLHGLTKYWVHKKLNRNLTTSYFLISPAMLMAKRVSRKTQGCWMPDEGSWMRCLLPKVSFFGKLEVSGGGQKSEWNNELISGNETGNFLDISCQKACRAMSNLFKLWRNKPSEGPKFQGENDNQKVFLSSPCETGSLKKNHNTGIPGWIR